jgi:hypothetical protein
MRLEKGSEFKVQGSMATAAIVDQTTGEPDFRTSLTFQEECNISNFYFEKEQK